MSENKAEIRYRGKKQHKNQQTSRKREKKFHKPAPFNTMLGEKLAEALKKK